MGKQDVQLTFGKDGVGEPQWSPDGRWLAFTTGREAEGDGLRRKGEQVWVLDRRGGEAQQLTNVKQELQGYQWSPDSKTLLLTLQERDEPLEEKGKPTPPKPIVIDRYHYKEDRVGFLIGQGAASLFVRCCDEEAEQADEWAGGWGGIVWRRRVGRGVRMGRWWRL